MHLSTSFMIVVIGTTSAQQSTQIVMRYPYPSSVQVLEGRISFSNQTLWTGRVKYEEYSEPYSPDIFPGGMSFTSWHQTPTGWQNPYIFENKTGPVEFTIAHGHSVPPGASTNGFSFDDNGVLNFHGKNKFLACQNKEWVEQGFYQIWWKGAGSVHGFNCSEPVSLVKYK